MKEQKKHPSNMTAEEIQKDIRAKQTEKAKDIEVISGTETKADKKTQKKSVSYALKAVKIHLETLQDNKLLSIEEFRKIREVINEATKKFIEQEYGL